MATALVSLLLLCASLLHARALTQQQGRQGDLDDTEAQELAIDTIENYSTRYIASDTYYGTGSLSGTTSDFVNVGIRLHTRLVLYGTGGCDGNQINYVIGYELVEAFWNDMLDVVRNQIRNGFGFGVVAHADDNLRREGVTAQFYYWVERIGQTDGGGATPNTHDTEGPSDDNLNRHDELSHVTGTFGSNNTYSIKLPHHMQNNYTRNFPKQRSGVQMRNVQSKVGVRNVSKEVTWSQNKKTRSTTSKIKDVQMSIVTKVGASNVSRTISRSQNNNITSNAKRRERHDLQARNATSLAKTSNASREINWSPKDYPQDCPPYNYALFTSNYDLNVLWSPSTGFAPDIIYSPNNLYYLRMQDDCNLVLYYFSPNYTPTPLWACGDACYLKGTMCHARLNLDGTLAVYDGNGNCLWYTPTQCSSGPGCWSDTYLAMQDDGNLVLYLLDTNVPIWATHTNNQ